MKTPKVVTAILCLSLMWGGSLVVAGTPIAFHATQKLHEIFPDSLKRASGGIKQTWSFCPDNTCIELAAAHGTNIDSWGVVYLYYLGDYYDLERWRAIHGIGTEVNELSKMLQLSKCVVGGKMDKSCLMDNFATAGIEIYNVRYDEGKRVAERLK